MLTLFQARVRGWLGRRWFARHRQELWRRTKSVEEMLRVKAVAETHAATAVQARLLEIAGHCCVIHLHCGTPLLTNRS